MEEIDVVGGSGSDADADADKELQEFERIGSSLRRRDQGRTVHGPKLLDLSPMLIFIGKCLCFDETRAIFLIHICYGRPL